MRVRLPGVSNRSPGPDTTTVASRAASQRTSPSPTTRQAIGSAMASIVIAAGPFREPERAQTIGR